MLLTLHLFEEVMNEEDDDDDEDDELEKVDDDDFEDAGFMVILRALGIKAYSKKTQNSEC